MAAQNGYTGIVKLLLRKGAKVDAIDARDGSGWTPRVHAFAEFRLDGAKLLVSEGAKASITDKYTYSPLNLMMKLGNKKTARLIDANLTE